MEKLEEGVYRIPLILPESLEARRVELQEILLKAQRRLRTFARKHGWLEFTSVPFADEVRIYESKQAFDDAVIVLLNLDADTELPPTACACLEEGILMAVTPEEVVRVYPQGDEDDFFEKLLTHEMTHRLHIRILEGDEDAMGPVWFYEGFAILASGQFERSTLEISPDEVWEIVESKERGSYEKYAILIKEFEKIDLEELVDKASEEGFSGWLKTRIQINS